MLSKICWMYFCQFNVHTFPFIITLVSTLFMLYVSESLSYVIVFHFSLSAFSITWACHLPETSLFPTFRHSLGGTPPLPPIWSKVNVAYSAHNSPNITTCRDPYPSWWLFFFGACVLPYHNIAHSWIWIQALFVFYSVLRRGYVSLMWLESVMALFNVSQWCQLAWLMMIPSELIFDP